jgi:predicted nucleotidyltransferase
VGRDLLIERVRQHLRTSRPAGLDLAIVFGSVARGVAKPSSDLDVAVLGAVDRLTLAATLSDAVGREVDVVEIAAASIPMVHAIVRDGVVAFERVSGIAAAFLAQSWTRLAVDLPWYERMQRTWLERVAARGLLGRS